MENSLASELERVQSMVRELEANMDQQEDLPLAAMEICGALASSIDRSLRIARSLQGGPDSPERSPPRGEGNNAAKDAQFKRRKGVPSVRTQVRVTAVQDMSALGDGFSWRKYGQKDILGAKYPRAYFRCTHRSTQSCVATKQVQRADADPLLFDVVYHGAHTCVQAAAHIATTTTEQHLQQPAGHTHAAAHQEQTAGFEPMTPSRFASTPAATEWQQLRNSDAGLELEHQLEQFFSNPSDYFQWDFQDL